MGLEFQPRTIQGDTTSIIKNHHLFFGRAHLIQGLYFLGELKDISFGVNLLKAPPRVNSERMERSLPLLIFYFTKSLPTRDLRMRSFAAESFGTRSREKSSISTFSTIFTTSSNATLVVALAKDSSIREVKQ
uniref:Uncharacterized protein n=1 Tax=Cannabis sativa TaxID=3483 RepID=A0A803PNH6_CANSA